MEDLNQCIASYEVGKKIMYQCRAPYEFGIR